MMRISASATIITLTSRQALWWDELIQCWIQRYYNSAGILLQMIRLWLQHIWASIAKPGTANHSSPDVVLPCNSHNISFFQYGGSG